MQVRSRSMPQRWQVFAAFAAVYLIWGSTYLGIRFAIETLPPLLMGGVRFTIAGVLLYAFMRRSGAPAPSLLHWRSAAIIGTLLLFFGNGGVIFAEQMVPSGTAALIVSMVPLWMALLEWWRTRVRPTAGVAVGLVLGLAGIVFLVGPDGKAGGTMVNPVGIAILVCGSIAWATGSLYSRGAPVPAAALLGTAMEMLVAGALLLVAAAATGEIGQVHPERVSLHSLLALGYLITFGSLVGYSCYIWLLRVSTPARVSTYAFVNPVVAVFLGWALAGEPLTLHTLAAAFVIITAVVLITVYQPRAAKKAPMEPRALRTPSLEGEPAEAGD